MSELNLIPQEFKIQNERKVRRNIYIAAALATILVMAGAAYVPVYIASLKEKENRRVVAEIGKRSYVTEQIKELNQQKNTLEDRINVLDGFTKNRVLWRGAIVKIAALIPPDVSVTGMSIGEDAIAMQCTALSQQSVAVFVANLQNSKDFEFGQIDGITPNTAADGFGFAVSFKYVKEESRVK